MSRIRLAWTLALIAGSPLAFAQVGPARATPFGGNPAHGPFMFTDQHSRTAVIDVTVGNDGHALGTTLVSASGSGIFDERVRGFWKDQLYLPALDASGQPQQDTLRVTSKFDFEPGVDGKKPTFRYSSAVDGVDSGTAVTRIGRMKCRDFLWEYDFMRNRAPRVDLTHEDIFRYSLAMYLAQRDATPAMRDALIARWQPLVDGIVEACRAQPDAAYWNEVFAPALTAATPR